IHVIEQPVQHIEINMIVISRIIIPKAPIDMMIRIKPAGFIPHRDTIADRHLWNGVRYLFGRPSRIAAALEAIAIAFTDKRCIIAVIKGPAMVEGRSLMTVNDVIPVVAIQPGPASPEDIPLT